ncbi:hypothetical protein ACJD0Z_14390 [Flavobacteriaceae bacterium M23B6Z8]
MNYLTEIVDYYTYRIVYFFSKRGSDNEWNLERSKNLLSLYGIIFSSILFFGIFELLDITKVLRQYSLLNTYNSKLLKLGMAVLMYFIFSSYFRRKVKEYEDLSKKFNNVTHKKLYDILIFMTIPLLLLTLGILLKISL